MAFAAARANKAMNSRSVSTPMVTNPTVSFPMPYSKISSTSSRRSAFTLPVRATVRAPAPARGAHRLDDVRAAPALGDEDLNPTGCSGIQSVESVKVPVGGKTRTRAPSTGSAKGRAAMHELTRTPKRRTECPGTALGIMHDQAFDQLASACEIFLEHPWRHLDAGFHGRLGIAHGTHPPSMPGASYARVHRQTRMAR